MKKVTGILVIVSAIYLLLSCTSTSTRTTQTANRITARLEQTARRNPNDANAQYDWGRRLYSPDSNYVQAVVAFERALDIDPDFRVTENFHWTRQTASTFGVNTTENIPFFDFSLFFFLGAAYYDGATSNDASARKFEERDRTEILEKSLDAFLKGYEIDITNKGSDSENLRIIYLGFIARILDLLGRTDEADTHYIELSEIIDVTDAITFRFLPCYFVSANGNDNNDGLSESMPLRTLAKAFEMANTGDIKSIAVIGTLNQQSEGGNDANNVFSLSSSIDSEILITGKPGAEGSERAVLSGTGSRRSVVSTYTAGSVRFEYIEISGGELNAENERGEGVRVVLSRRVVIGTGTVIRDNRGAGVYVSSISVCTMTGGEIRDNRNSGVTNYGTFNLQGGTIRNNRSVDGGGIYNESGATSRISGGTITGNTATGDGGGIYIQVSFLNNRGIVAMTGGTISNNSAANGYGGGVYVGGVKEDAIGIAIGGRFWQDGGTIRGNRAGVGGGVFVMGFNGAYDQSGGTVTGNTATHTHTLFAIAIPGSNADVFRVAGSLSSDW